MFLALTALIAMQPDNTLTPKEIKDGWQLLFDGKTMDGWHNFNSDTIKSGWKVVDGCMEDTDANNAGDIITNDKYEWFELQVDFNYDKGQNSGVMYHVADTGEEIWHSGPEIQIYDHKAEPGVQITGYLYELYGSPIDASKPAGQWNHFRIIVAPKKCMTYVNGVKYYEYVLNSPDFKARVAKSKFAQWPEFATLSTGHIGIQGDHGNVKFKNIKIRVIKG